MRIGTAPSKNEPLHIGKGAVGVIDEMRLYDRAITANENKFLFWTPGGGPGRTEISGNQVTTGLIKSKNYAKGSTGSVFNLETGELETQNGIFRGHIEADSGSFKGHVEADSGTFKGHVEADSGTFKGRIESLDGFFHGAINANNANIQGTISAGGQFEGDITTPFLYSGSDDSLTRSLSSAASESQAKELYDYSVCAINAIKSGVLHELQNSTLGAKYIRFTTWVEQNEWQFFTAYYRDRDRWYAVDIYDSSKNVLETALSRVRNRNSNSFSYPPWPSYPDECNSIDPISSGNQPFSGTLTANLIYGSPVLKILNLSSFPTSPTGLSQGDLYRDGDIIKVKL